MYGIYLSMCFRDRYPSQACFDLTVSGAPSLDSFRSLQEEVGPAVDCKLESDIFRMLGLDYVPFRMRWWYNYE